MIKMIALAGFAGAGKDSVGTALAEVGYGRVAWADPVYRGLLAIDPYVPWDGGGGSHRLSWLVAGKGWDRAKREHPEVRRLLQRYGTEGGRGIHGDDCWIRIGMRTAAESGPVVFTDTRFPNEAEAVVAAGGQVWRVHRHGVEAANGHSSEHALDGWHGYSWHVWNNGSLDDLRRLVLESMGVRGGVRR